MGMVHTFVRFFQPKVTIQYPEERQEISPHHRGRLLLLYDEAGNLKCETCFQCAMACPIEIIDMGGVDTKGRYHVHWGPPEQYAERREESALRRQRPARARSDVRRLAADRPRSARADPGREDYDPRRLLTILEQTQAAYGHLPVAAIQHISHATGAWYSEIYGIATSYPHLVFEPGRATEIGLCRCPNCTAARRRPDPRRARRRRWRRTSAGSRPTARCASCAADCGGESRDEPLRHRSMASHSRA